MEYEQGGKARAEYGEAPLETLAYDLTDRFGRGFSYPNLNKFRQFHLAFPQPEILSTVSIESHSSLGEPKEGSARASRVDQILQIVSAESGQEHTAVRFPLPWSAYARLLAVKNEHARRFYETEVLRGGWSVRQLGRQIDAQFYERTALSRNKGAILKKGALARPEDTVSAEQEVKDPYVLEFLTILHHGTTRSIVRTMGSPLALLGSELTRCSPSPYQRALTRTCPAGIPRSPVD